MECLNEGVVKILDNNNRDNFDVDFPLAHPLEYLLEETLCGKCLVNHGYMEIFGWSETYIHIYHDHDYKTLMIY